uniref:Uncharacterized protein n=1 Tax=Mesocestoides corti TaxID=53468 RepID=A0A5K3FF43_MESCO
MNKLYSFRSLLWPLPTDRNATPMAENSGVDKGSCGSRRGLDELHRIELRLQGSQLEAGDWCWRAAYVEAEFCRSGRRIMDTTSFGRTVG